MINRKEYGHLSNLLEAWFHQDWFEMYDSNWRSLITDFIARESAENLKATADDIDRLIAENGLSEENLRMWLRELSSYMPHGDVAPGISIAPTIRQSLAQLRDEIRSGM